jgi:hypothetical protein
MRAILLPAKTDPYDPLINEACILAGAEMIRMINPAWENVVAQRAAATLKPGQKAGSCVGEQFELGRSAGLSLHDGCPCPDLPADDDIADFEADHIATAQLAVDRHVEQRPVAQKPSVRSAQATAILLDSQPTIVFRPACGIEGGRFPPHGSR